MIHAAEKVRQAGDPNVFLCERGSQFGYNDLIVDVRNLVAMRAGAPVVQDVTHSVQQPGGLGNQTGILCFIGEKVVCVDPHAKRHESLT